MQLGEHLQSMLALLREVYPHGIPEPDYSALLLVLQDFMSEENLSAVVAELIDGERVVVANDAASASSRCRPKPEDVKRVRAILEAHGLNSEEPDV